MLRALLLSALAFGAPAVHAETLISKLWVDGKLGAAMDAGKPALLQFEFTDQETGGMPHHFHEMHAKPMHLIAVSEDLSEFGHVHPTSRPHSRKAFELRVNSATQDPDNFALPDLIQRAGKYFLFGEVMPMDYGMLAFPYDLEVRGTARSPEPLNLDPLEADGTILKVFESDGLRYRAHLRVEPLLHCGVLNPKLNLELALDDGSGAFVPLTDLDLWLESYGHAIVMGSQGQTAAAKVVNHLHAVWPLPTGDQAQDERGPFLELAAHSHGQSAPADRYRAWVQIKHRGKVLTWMFTFEWKPEPQSLTLPWFRGFCR